MDTPIIFAPLSPLDLNKKAIGQEIQVCLKSMKIKLLQEDLHEPGPFLVKCLLKNSSIRFFKYIQIDLMDNFSQTLFFVIFKEIFFSY